MFTIHLLPSHSRLVSALALPVAALDPIQESIISWLLLVLLIPQQRRSLAFESVWNPRILVTNAPHCHSNTTLSCHARPRNALERLRLDLELGRSGGSVHADIDLSVDNVDAKLSEALESTLEDRLLRCRSGSSWCGLRCKVTLEADAVNERLAFLFVRLDELDDALSTGCFRASIFEVEVVVVELRLRVCLAGELESKRDVGLADGVVKDTFAVGAVFVEC